MRAQWLVLVLLNLLWSVNAIIPSTPSTDVSDYELFFGNPSGCGANTTCQYFVGLRLNDNDSRWLDVYLSAAATEWVAVGFSTSLNMADSDVVGCTVESGGTSVIALDTWNQNQVAVPGDNNNILDDAQDGIMLGFSELDDNRITCTLSRLISGTQDPPQDQNLNGSYYFLFGYKNGRRPAAATGFTIHRFGTALPDITRQLFNPVTDFGELTLDAAIVTPAVPAPNIQPEDYRLRRRSPDGCDPQSCDYFMGININRGDSNFLDFYLTAKISGWVAVGFSSTANMTNADVVGCNAANGGVSADDTHNSAGTRINNADSTNDAILHFGDFTDGRITCIFSRSIAGSDAPPQDLPLNTSYFFLFGVGASAGVARFPDHGNLIPSISNGQFNPATSDGQLNPATSSPATSSPATSNPATSSPATSSPATSSPATSSPATSSPATSNPATSSPATSSPATSGHQPQLCQHQLKLMISAVYIVLLLVELVGGVY